MSTDLESLDEFRARARAFITDNLRPLEVGDLEGYWRDRTDEEELADVARDREVQRLLWDGGLAGVCVPRAYGGQGLSPAHQRVLNEEMRGHEYPTRFQIPTFSPCMAVILDHGTEEQKLSHVPAMLRGEELWMQFLSEPSGGSDVAGALTTAVRDGDEWVLNGSKVWTTGAWWSDWGLCLARTNWDVQKHRGLSVFMFPIRSEGIEVQRIEMLNGSQEFCQEYLTDLRVPDTARVGEVDQGWTVGTRWMFHERMSHNSPLVTIPAGSAREGIGGAAVRAMVRDAGRLDDPRAQELIGEAEMLDLVGDALKQRIGRGLATGTMSDQSSAIGRLYAGATASRRVTIEFELAGATGAAWTDDDGELAGRGMSFLMRQVGSIGGGTTEMAANVISERVLGMPRERSLDRDVPFRDVPRSAPQS
jgi:alkylation response protein AidB-like acyl-CoA dehydrogenase